jgi:hypothetical protein
MKLEVLFKEFFLYENESIASYYFIIKSDKENASKKTSNNIININEKENFFLVNLRDKLSSRKLNPYDLYFKQGEFELFIKSLGMFKTPMYVLRAKYSLYVSQYKIHSLSIMEERDWESELRILEDKDLEEFREDNFNPILKKASKVEKINELQSYIYKTKTKRKVRKTRMELKRRIIKKKLIDKTEEGLSINLVNPHYYLPPNYNRKSRLGQLRHWNTSVYTYVRGDKRMNIHLDLYGSNLIEIFFNVKAVYTWIRDWESVLNGIILKDEINRINNIMFLYAYNWFNFPLKKKILRIISKVLNEKWKLDEIDYYKYMLVQPVASIFGLNKNLSEEKYFQKKKRWMISKPLFKHTSFNVIIDLFIFNNKSYREYIMQNILTRRTLYKYMSSMYTNFSEKVKASYSRPRFFYINILEPNIAKYYFKVVRTYEKIIMFKTGIFKLYLYYFLLQMKFLVWKKNYVEKSNLPYLKVQNSGLKENYYIKISEKQKKKYMDDLPSNFPTHPLKGDSLPHSSIEKEKFNKLNPKKDNKKLSLIKLNNLKKWPIIKKEYLLNKSSLMAIKSSLLLKEEREDIMNLYNMNNHWLELTYEGINTLEQQKEEIGSWWDAVKARQEKLAKKAKADELLYKKYKNMTNSGEKITRNWEERSKDNKRYLEENSVLNKKNKGKKRRKQDEYLIWLQKSEEEKEEEKQNKRKDKFSVDEKLLGNKSISFEEIQKEYYKKYPEKLNAARLSWEVKDAIEKEILAEKEKDNMNKLENTVEVVKEKKFKWDSSLFNISTIQDWTKKALLEKYSINNIINLSNTDSPIPLHINNFNHLSQLSLKSSKDLKNEDKKLSENIIENNINTLSENLQDKRVNDMTIYTNVNDKIKNLNSYFLVKSQIKKSLKIDKESNYTALRKFIDLDINLKDLWENKESNIFNIINLVFKNIFKFKSIKENNIFNKIFYSSYNNMRLFRGYGLFWYWYYYSAVVQKEFYKVNRDILKDKTFTILPRTEDTRSIRFLDDINIPHNRNVYTNNGKIFARFWPLYYISDKDSNDNDSFYYNSAIFKPYYRYMIPLYVLKLFIDSCVRTKEYSIAYLGNVFLRNNKRIRSNVTLVSHFLLVKVLLDLLRYNYRSLIRFKPKYYFLNRARRIKQKYVRASLNHWISINRGFKIGRKSPKLFWHRFVKLLNHYYLHLVRDAELSTQRQILVPFVLYFEDLLFTIYGKWALIRLWPLKRFYLSSYILANRLLMLTLWRTNVRKKKMKFADRTAYLMKIFHEKEIQSYYDYYVKTNHSWPSFLLNKFNNETKKDSLNFSKLESYYTDLNMADRLSIYPRLYNEPSHFSAILYQYSTVFRNSLAGKNNFEKRELMKIKKKLEWSVNWIPNYEELSKYWLKPFNDYLIDLRSHSDISGIRFKLAGKVRHARSNARSTYKDIYSGNFFGPRHTHPLFHKKIPLNVQHIRGRMKSYIDYARSDAWTDGGAVSLKIWLYARFSADVQELLLYLTEIKYLYHYLMNRSYNIDPRLKKIESFLYHTDLFGLSEKWYRVSNNQEFIVKGKTYNLEMPSIVSRKVPTGSHWPLKKRNSQRSYVSRRRYSR